jgi:hypothetical protein
VRLLAGLAVVGGLHGVVMRGPEHIIVTSGEQSPVVLAVGARGRGVGGVADSVNSQPLAIRDALDRRTATTGRVLSAGDNLNDPLGMVVASNGDIVTVNGNDGQAVETTQAGTQVATATFDNNNGGGGNLFGLALTPNQRGVYFVDDFASDNFLFGALK